MTRLLSTLLAILALPAFADAHAVGVTARLASGDVRLEAFFDDDEPAAGAKVTVRDAADALVAEGTTDAAGVWSFAVPQAGKYTVRVDAGDGHAATTVIVVPQGAAEAAAISGGASREARTGWHRWAGVAVGLLAIAAGTKVFSRFQRQRAKAG